MMDDLRKETAVKHDELLTFDDACDELVVCATWLEYRLRMGLIRGYQCQGGDWMLFWSDVMAVKVELCNPSGWLRSVCDETAVKEFLEL